MGMFDVFDNVFEPISDFFSGGLGDVVGGIGGSVASGLFAKSEAEKLRSWQTDMSNTAHQREVADLLAAGLNPILSATGGSGASTPVGAKADTPDFEKGVTSAMQLRTQKQEIKESKSREKLNEVGAKKAAQDILTAKSQEGLNNAAKEYNLKNLEIAEIKRLVDQMALQRKQAEYQTVDEGIFKKVIPAFESMPDWIKGPARAILTTVGESGKALYNYSTPGQIINSAKWLKEKGEPIRKKIKEELLKQIAEINRIEAEKRKRSSINKKHHDVKTYRFTGAKY